MSETPCLLLVEDDESDVLFLKRAFAKTGVKIPLQVVENGRKAIEYLAGNGPYWDRTRYPAATHLLLDLKLPEKSGFEVLGWIRSQTGLKNLRVVILTSSAEESDIQRASQLGVDSYLVKPIHFTLLLETAKAIDEWVRNGRAPESYSPSQTISRSDL
jgi:CheY-like chemotaxis protein